MISDRQIELALFNRAIQDARTRIKGTKQEVLRDIASALDQNLERIRAVAAYPVLLIGITSTVQHARIRACIEVLGKPAFEESDHSRQHELQQRFQDLMNQERPRGADDPRNLVVSDYILTTVLDHDGPIRLAFDAILSSLLLNVWMAFESTAIDLWTKAVDLRPQRALQGVIKDKQSSEQDKTIPLSVLLKRGFDLSKCMGTYLKDAGKVEFVSLKTTQRAYSKVFGDEAETIFDSEQLRTLERIRNLFAHRGGVVDRKFHHALRDNTAWSGRMEVGKPLQVTMADAKDLSADALARITDLLKFVDDWLCE